MRANEFLWQQIAEDLQGDAANRKKSGMVEGFLKGKTGVNDYRTGYGLLNGANSDVGGLQYWGMANIAKDGSITYDLQIHWNDRIDPNRNHMMDIMSSYILKKIGNPKNYNVHIGWNDIFILTPVKK